MDGMRLAIADTREAIHPEPEMKPACVVISPRMSSVRKQKSVKETY